MSTESNNQPGNLNDKKQSTLNTQLKTLLSERGKDDESISNILHQGAQVNAVVGNETMLNVFLKNPHNNRTKTLELLLEHGADVNRRGFDGQTPLHHIVGETFRQRVFTGGNSALNFIKRINVTPGDAPTPLRDVHNQHYCTMIEMLLAEGADPNVINNQGQTALHSLAQGWERLPRVAQESPYALYQYAEIAQSLIRKDADPDICDRDGHTAADYVANPMLKRVLTGEDQKIERQDLRRR